VYVRRNKNLKNKNMQEDENSSLERNSSYDNYPPQTEVSRVVSANTQKIDFTSWRAVGHSFNRSLLFVTIWVVGLCVVLSGAFFFLLNRSSEKAQKQEVSQTEKLQQTTLNTSDVALQVSEAQKLAVNGQLQVGDSIVIVPSDIPKNPIKGQIYFSKKTNAPFYFDGANFVSLAPIGIPQHVSSLGGSSGSINVGNGLEVANGQIGLNASITQAIETASAPRGPTVQTLQGRSGNVTLTAGRGIAISGTTISNQGLLSLASGSSSLSVAQDGNGNYTVSSSAVSGAGSVNQIAMYTGTQTLAGSILSQSGTTVIASGSLTVTGGLNTNLISQTAAGQNVAITAGNDTLSFTAGGRTFTFPLSGSANQIICTSGASCTTSGVSVSLQPGSAQTDVGNGSSVFINNTGGGELIHLQGAGTDRFVVDNDGTTTIAGTLTVSGASIAVGSASQQGSFTFGAGNGLFGTMQVASLLAQNTTYILPDPGANSATICLSTGNCGSGLTGTGIAGRIALFNGAGSLTSSTLSESAGTVSTTGDISVQGAGGVSLGQANANDGSLRFFNAAGSNAVTLLAPTANPVSNLNFRLPSSYGNNGYCLLSDGAGQLSFNSCTGGIAGGVTTLNGQNGVVSLNNATGSAGSITINDASTAQKGIAQFNSTNFTASGGVVNTAQNINTSATPTFGGLTLNGFLQGSGDVVIQTSTNSTTAFRVLNDTASRTVITADTINGRIGIGAPNPNYLLDVQGGTGVVGNFSGRVRGVQATNTDEFVTLGQVGSIIGAPGDYIQNGTAAQSADFNITGTGTIGTLSVSGGGSVSGNFSVTGASTLASLGVTNNATVGGTLGVTGAINGQTISNAANFTGSLTVQGSAGVVVGVANTTTGGVSLAHALSGFLGTINVANLGQAVTYVLPDPGAGTADICLSSGNCAGTGGGLIGSGTSGRIAKFTSGNTLANSLLNESGSAITNTGDFNVQGTNGISVGQANTTAGSLRFYNTAGANTVSLLAPTVNPASNLTFRLPSSYGNNGYCLQTNGAGVLSFNPCTGGAAGGVSSINGQSDIVTLNNATGSAGSITINDASTAQKGIAQFNSTNFTASGGVINTIQNIDTTASPSFAGLTTTATLNANGGVNTGNANITAGTGSVTAGTVNATSALQLNGTNINTAGTLTNVAYLNQNNTFTGNVNIQGTNGLTLGNAGVSNGFLNLANSTSTRRVLVQGLNPSGAGDATVQIPSIAGGSTDTVCLLTLANCAGTGGGLTGSGVNNYLARFTAGNTLGSSTVYDTGSAVYIGATSGGGLFNVGASNQFNVSATGAVTAVGINAGSGLIQGSAGLTISAGSTSLAATSIAGTATINSTGTANTSLGNATGILTVTGSSSSTFVLNGVTIDATEFNLLNGKDTALVDTTDAVNTAITGTGILASGSIDTGFGTINTGNNITTSATAQAGTVNATSALQLNGTNINAAGTLTNVAYLNQNNNFTGTTNTFSGNLTVNTDGNITQSGSGTFSTGTGGVSLNGATSITGTNTLSVGGTSTFTGNIAVNTTPNGNNKLLVNAPTTAVNDAEVIISTGNVANKALVIQGVLSQADNLAEFQNSAGTVRTYIDSAARLHSSNGFFDNSLFNTASALNVTNNDGAVVGAIIKSASASQTADILQFNDQNDASAAKFLGYGNTLRLGRISSTGTATYQGSLELSDGTLSGFGSTLRTNTLTDNRIINLPNEAGTLCIQSSTNCGFAPTTGSANYIQNQTASPQAAGFYVNGSGRVASLTVDGATDINTSSATALRVRNGATNSLVVDTTTGKTVIGSGTAATNGILTVGTATTTNTGGINFGGDVDLYRYAAGILRSTGGLILSSSATAFATPGNHAARGIYLENLNQEQALNITSGVGSGASDLNALIRIGQVSDANSRFSVRANGAIRWGNGSANQETQLQRTAAGELTVQNVGTGGGLGPTTFVVQAGGTQGTTDLLQVKNGATVLTAVKSDGGILTDINSTTALRVTHSGGTGDQINLLTVDTTNGRVNIAAGSGTGALNVSNSTVSGAAHGIVIGGDTNLYRNAGGELKTDSNFLAEGRLISGSSTATKVGVGVALDGTTLAQSVVFGTSSSFDAQVSRTGVGALKVTGSSNSATAFTVQSTTNVSAIIVSNSNVSNGYNAANATLKVASDSGTGRSINAAGTVNTGGADYAEWIPWTGAKPEQGSVVRYAGSRYIVSSPTTAGFVGNDKISGANSILVAFIGQLPVKVTGAVQVGDFLIDNGDGTVRAVSPANATFQQIMSKVAIAQETSTDTGVKKIQASVGTTSDSVADGLQSANGMAIGGTTSLETLNVSGQSTLANLSVTGDVEVAGTLTVATIKVDTLTLEGHFVTAGDVPQASVLGAQAAGTQVTIDGNDTAGTITITTGAQAVNAGDLVDVTFSKAFGKAPRIIISGQNALSSGVRIFPSTKTAQGYKLQTAEQLPAGSTYTFDYFVVE
jgi:fibronectin-binding autotransporter adhesin